MSADLEHVIRTAIDVSASSDGAFDVTVAPLVEAWGFGAGGEHAELPDDATVAGLKVERRFLASARAHRAVGVRKELRA